ncbi:MAG: ATP-binding protein [Bacteroidia bacterium]|nr:ATP-binding protein [Bacteroidia bacterium]
MKIRLQGKFRSLSDFETPVLPNLCIITGLNGSGKSQLLSLLNNLNDRQEKEVFYDGYNFKIEIISDSYVPGKIANFHFNGISFSHDPSFRETPEAIKHRISSNLNTIRSGSTGYKYSKIIESISKASGKPLDQLTQKDIVDYEISPKDLIGDEFFRDHIHEVFYYYCWIREENQAKSYRNEKFRTSFEIFSNEEFDKKYEAPWILINKFLEKIKSHYLVEGISVEEFYKDKNFIPKLRHKESNELIRFNSLSSGERVMMSLAVSLYNFYVSGSHTYPSILLLDEPDAMLHPSLTRDFLEVIQEEIVNKRNIKVFLTTHSPSTVALVDENFLYGMSATGKRFFKTTKDKALSLLTSGLNTLSIDYENRRQIFVESKYDQEFYELIASKIKDQLIEGISLHFIPSGIDKVPVSNEVPDGDSKRVRNVVKALSEDGGNRNIFGIIDWDGKNSPSMNVFVNGNSIRYSLENYIFDPIILSAFLLDLQILSRDQLGLSDKENYTDLKTFSDLRLKGISDFICEKIKANIKLENLIGGTSTVQYLNGSRIEVPKWYLEYPAHELENSVIDTFPKLRSEFGQKVNMPNKQKCLDSDKNQSSKKEIEAKFENRLKQLIKRKIVTKTFDNLPGFIPVEIKDLLLGIQKKS